MSNIETIQHLPKCSEDRRVTIKERQWEGNAIVVGWIIRGEFHVSEAKNALKEMRRSCPSSEYIIVDKEKKCETQRKWSKRNPEKRRQLMADWRAKNIKKVMWHGAKERAKRNNVPFTITEDDIVIPERCIYEGILLSRSDGKIGSASPVLDRKIPEKGYVPGNVVVISSIANLRKRDFSASELRRYANILDSLVKEVEIECDSFGG